MTVGPWKPISLHFYESRIVDLDVRSQVSEALDVKVTVDLTFSETTPGLASFILKAPDGSVVATKNDIPTENGHTKVPFDFEPGKLDLWYPVGYGKQPLYTVEVELANQVGFTSFARVFLVV